ncbi:MAG: hypothetical protein ACRETH_10990 [Steroidobacteraceae bacterium]
MTHITVHPFGARRSMPMAAAAVAYVADSVAGASIIMIGGGTLRVSDSVAEVEYALGWTQPESKRLPVAAAAAPPKPRKARPK